MKFNIRTLVVIYSFFFSFFSSSTCKGDVFEFTDTSSLYIGKYVDILVEKDSLTFSEVIHSNQFKKSEKLIPNLGITKNVFWVRFTIKNQTKHNNVFLEFSQPLVNFVSFFYPSNGSYHILYAGDHFKFNQRPYKYPNFIFNLDLKPGEEKTYYLKIKSSEQILLPLKVSTPEETILRQHHEDIIFGLYAGIIFVMFLYNLFIYFTVKDKIYLYYVFYILFIGFTQACILGYPFQYLWPNNPTFANLSVYIFPCCVGLTAMEFLKEFLETAQNCPKWHKGSYAMSAMYVFTGIITLLGYMHIGYIMVEAAAAVISIYMLMMAFVVYKQGSKQAKFFLIAWSSMLIGIIIFVLKDFNLLPTNNFTSYTMPAGSALETMLLSFALADRINILKKEKEASQAAVFRALQENEKLILEQNVLLEQKVTERTEELAKTNGELNLTLKNLKNTQAQLVSAEKMASLGQLTAGIAHEINNPINFVSANVKPLQMDIADIMEIISKYENIQPDDTLPEQLKAINDYKKKIDLDYTKTEIQTLLSGIEDGAKRTAEIVKGLKTFSRLDESDVKTANINEGIESTLVMIRSAIPQNITVVKHLGDIPIIECLPGKLNQVFMNTFNNAIQAIEEKKSGGTLTISSYAKDEEHIQVTIEDTGIGMTPETKERIFDPFFTTKDVGQGTGLGMSIVFTIIESHNGSIDIETEYGKGTKLSITLPIKLKLS